MEDGPEILDHWDGLVSDMKRLVGDLEDDGWDVIEIYSASVVPIVGGRSERRNGLSVTIPDNRFERLEAAIDEDGVEFDAYDVYRKREGEFVLLAVAMKDSRRDRAVVFPAYYLETEGAEMLRQAREEGRIHVHLRRLRGQRITLGYDEPALFAPE